MDCTLQICLGSALMLIKGVHPNAFLNVVVRIVSQSTSFLHTLTPLQCVWWCPLNALFLGSAAHVYTNTIVIQHSRTTLKANSGLH